MTPNSAAFLALEPAPGPATRISVFALTDPATLAPRLSARALASARVIFSNDPVKTTIFPVTGLSEAACHATGVTSINSATNALGTLDELYVIAAAVIGGTSLAGGVGKIYGAILGALVMQSLQSGMVLIGFDSAIQRIVVGMVLVLAVYLDILYNKRVK